MDYDKGTTVLGHRPGRGNPPGTEGSIRGSLPKFRKEGFSIKKPTNPRRIVRNFLIAAVIVSMLAVTAFAATGFLLYDSPVRLVAARFGDETGCDHKEITTWSDPQKPGSLYTNSAYERQEADGVYVSGDNVKTVALRFADGSSYQVRNDTTDNTIFAIISSDGEKDPRNLLTLMFNRVIQVDGVRAVVVNGTELTID